MHLKRIVIVMLFLLSTYSFADFNAQVVYIIDGDTVDVLDSNNQKFRIRLLGIEAPEKKQSFGYESTLYLKKRISGEFVTIISRPNNNKPYTLDFYKRILGKINLNGIDINLEMVKKGMAWHYKKYKKNQPIDERQSYNKAESNAREKNIGLWVGDRILPPWKWRQQNRKR